MVIFPAKHLPYIERFILSHFCTLFAAAYSLKSFFTLAIPLSLIPEVIA